MPGHMEFTYDDDNDIVTAIPKWHIQTEEECRLWHDEWVEYLQKFGRKMDCIMILTNFKLDADIGSVWGRYRAEINNRFIRYGYRVNPDMAVSLYVKTSGIRYNAATAEAADYDSAVKAIMAARAAGK
jgi:hypothetical protein